MIRSAVCEMRVSSTTLSAFSRIPMPPPPSTLIVLRRTTWPPLPVYWNWIALEKG
jgi:hypothetical protein